MNTQDKKAIVLFGRANTGKTTALKLLIEKLKSSSTLIKERSYYNRAHNETDKWAIFKHNGLLIAVVTGGDGLADIKKYLDDIDIYIEKSDKEELIGKEIDMFILACRSKGKSIQFIIDNFAYVLWERKWGVEESNKTCRLLEIFQDEANEYQTDAILRTISSI
jgi:hypothetical protein